MPVELRKKWAAGGDAGPDPAVLRRRLLAWYRRRRRPLPWRETSDPYRIWVSEIMLQQTQVAATLGFYQRFLERFPTVESLAASRESEVLESWAGLGYYRRARALREAARLVVREHGGSIPRDPDRFGRLPGVGRDTTGAVLSIAFGRPLPALDGNAARVLSRLYARPLAIRVPGDARALWDLASSLVPARDPGAWNQALMELGAVICAPRNPACETCPVRTICRARRLGIVDRLPPASARRSTEIVRRAAALITRAGRMLVVRREGALLEGLWEPPGIQLSPRESARARLEVELAKLGIRAALEPSTRSVRHRITHRDVRVELWNGTLLAPAPRTRAIRFVDGKRPRVALTAFARRVLTR
jgi:A/G-specific adenine glycosylase